jgi:NAD(P)-dependent dehydrogenase (short-subunit alcohol dehydrogenase family)
MSTPPTSVLLVGAAGPVTDEIAARVAHDGGQVACARDMAEEAVERSLEPVTWLDAVVIVLPQPLLGTALLAVTDEQLERSLEQFLDLFAALRNALGKLADGGSIVVVGDRGFLGAWGGAHEMAFSGAVVGLLRSVTLENMARGVRANVIAADLPSAHEASAEPREIADLVAFLLSPAASALNGELLLATAGRSLQMREGRDRRRSRTPANAA